MRGQSKRRTDYTLARNIRELQPNAAVADHVADYTLARNIRELQRFVLIFRMPYQLYLSEKYQETTTSNPII